MNAARPGPFFFLPFPGESSATAFSARPKISLVLSCVLHAALLGLALFLSAASGGMPGSGAGNGFGPGGGFGAGGAMYLSGMISLPGGPEAEEDAAFSEDAASASAAPPVASEELSPKEKDADPVQPEPEAIPVPAPEKRLKDKQRNHAGARQAEKHKEQSPSASQAELTRVRRAEREMNMAPASGERNGIGAGQTGGEGGDPGGGRGLHPGAGGSARGTGGQGAGFSVVVDSKPRVISRSRVRYPESARKQRLTGHVLLRFHLDEKGGVSHLRVVRAEPPGVFEEAALTAVRQWRFAPAMKDGRPVPYWVELPMPFLLK